MKYRTRMILLLIVLMPAPLAACLWDSDTLEEERRQFPTVLELITGKFLRHSPAFYDWRIADRKRRIEKEPDNVALYDDLAVAYEKSGQTELATETILKKEEISPGLYETYANLGTFYIHAGRLDEGLKEIEKAIELNPDAHFGREVYQKLLVEYVLANTTDGELQLPMFPDSNGDGSYAYGFGFYVMESKRHGAKWTDDEYREEGEKATNGILGMMRFGNYDSPVLLEALSDLLMMRSDQAQAKQLAARALLQASYVSTELCRQSPNKNPPIVGKRKAC
jgi:tetratricopeptide (TPR) repeat protein